MIIIPTPDTMGYREYRRMIGLRAQARATVQWACGRTGFPDLDLVTLNNLLGEPPPYEYSTWWTPIYNGRYEWMIRQLQELIRLLRADPASLGRLEDGNSALNPLMQINRTICGYCGGLEVPEEFGYFPREGEIILSGRSYVIRSDDEWREVELTPRRSWTHDFECQMSILELPPPSMQSWQSSPFVPWRPVSIERMIAGAVEGVGSLEDILRGFDRILAMQGSADEKTEKSTGELPFKPEEKSDDNYEALIRDMENLLEEE